MRVLRWLFFLLFALPAAAQTPPAAGAYLGSGSPVTWTPWTATLGSNPIPYAPPGIALYCFTGSVWEPCNPLSPSDAVTSFNGRIGAVTPQAGDYSYSQLSNSPFLVASAEPGADACAKIEAAITALASTGGTVIGDFDGQTSACASGFTVTQGVTVELRPMILSPIGATITVNAGGHLLGATGCATGGAADNCTYLAAGTNLNAPVVLLEDAGGSSTFWHYGELGWLTIYGNAANQSSATSCLKLNQPGDTSDVHSVMLLDCGSYSFEIDGSMSGTAQIRGISIFNGTAGGGLYFNGTSSSIHLYNIHVGGTVGPALTCSAGSGGVVIAIDGFEIEGQSVSGASTQAFYMDGTNGHSCHLEATRITASSISSGTDLFYRNSAGSSSASFSVEARELLGVTQFTNIFHDAKGSYTIPSSSATGSSGYVDEFDNRVDASMQGAIALQPSGLSLSNGLNSNVFFYAASADTYSTSNVLVSGPTAAFSIGGLYANDYSSGAVNGYLLVIENPTAYSMTIVNQDASSTAANRITTGTGANVVLPAGSSATLIYNVATTTWYLQIGAATAGTGNAVLAAAMTASSGTVGLGTTGSGNSTFSWTVSGADWYHLQCSLPVTFTSSATIAFELYSVSGSVTVSNVNSRTSGDTGALAIFQDLSTIGGSSLAGSETPTTGAPGAVSEMMTATFDFLTSHAGNIGLEFVGNGSNTVQPLAGGTCSLTLLN